MLRKNELVSAVNQILVSEYGPMTTFLINDRKVHSEKVASKLVERILKLIQNDNIS